MRLRDVLDPNRALSALMKLAVCLILLFVVFQFVVCLLQQASAAAWFALLCLFLLLSLVAYLIRQKRQGRQQQLGARRGAERTPLLPQNEEVR